MQKLYANSDRVWCQWHHHATRWSVFPCLCCRRCFSGVLIRQMSSAFQGEVGNKFPSGKLKCSYRFYLSWIFWHSRSRSIVSNTQYWIFQFLHREWTMSTKCVEWEEWSSLKRNRVAFSTLNCWRRQIAFSGLKICLNCQFGYKRKRCCCLTLTKSSWFDVRFIVWTEWEVYEENSGNQGPNERLSKKGFGYRIKYFHLSIEFRSISTNEFQAQALENFAFYCPRSSPTNKTSIGSTVKTIFCLFRMLFSIHSFILLFYCLQFVHRKIAYIFDALFKFYFVHNSFSWVLNWNFHPFEFVKQQNRIERKHQNNNIQPKVKLERKRICRCRMIFHISCLPRHKHTILVCCSIFFFIPFFVFQVSRATKSSVVFSSNSHISHSFSIDVWTKA